MAWLEIDSAYYVLYYLDVWYEGASLDKHEAGEGQAVWKRRATENLIFMHYKSKLATL